jgi:hypothetical protein
MNKNVFSLQVERGSINMSLSKNWSQQGQAVPLVYHLQRVFFAVCILLAPLTVSLWFGLCPEYGNPACPVGSSATLVAFRAANPLLLQLFFVVTFISAYVYPLSYIGLGLLAMKRAPWLSTIGIACGFVGSIPWGAFADQSFLLNTMAHLRHDTLFATLVNSYFSINPEAYVMSAGWVIGHLFGYVLLGIALARARVIPQWAAWLLIVSPLLMGPLAYGTGLGLLQVLGYVLVFVGSVPSALVMLKVSDKQAWEPRGEKPMPTT